MSLLDDMVITLEASNRLKSTVQTFFYYNVPKSFFIVISARITRIILTIDFLKHKESCKFAHKSYQLQNWKGDHGETVTTTFSSTAAF